MNIFTDPALFPKIGRALRARWDAGTIEPAIHKAIIAAGCTLVLALTVAVNLGATNLRWYFNAMWLPILAAGLSFLIWSINLLGSDRGRTLTSAISRNSHVSKAVLGLCMFLAGLGATHTINSLTKESPGHFLEAVPLVAAPTGLVLLAGVIILLLNLIGLVLFSQGIVLVLVSESRSKYRRLLELLGRPGPDIPKSWNATPQMIRAFGACAIAALIASPFVGPQFENRFYSAASHLLVTASYMPAHQCTGLPNGARVAELNGNRVSVATRDTKGRYHFETRICRTELDQIADGTR